MGDIRMTHGCHLLRDEELRIIEVGRAILADPEVMVVHKALSSLTPRQRKKVLKVLIAWQKGGLQGLLKHLKHGNQEKHGSSSELEKDKDNPYPAWLSPNGEVKRTLLMATKE